MKYKVGKSVGCPHFIRGAELKCETCGEFYACRFCHDEVQEDHRFAKYETKLVKCMRCHRE